MANKETSKREKAAKDIKIIRRINRLNLDIRKY